MSQESCFQFKRVLEPVRGLVRDISLHVMTVMKPGLFFLIFHVERFEISAAAGDFFSVRRNESHFNPMASKHKYMGGWLGCVPQGHNNTTNNPLWGFGVYLVERKNGSIPWVLAGSCRPR